MSDDIVDRLRGFRCCALDPKCERCQAEEAAADEIEREREASALHHHEWKECEGVIAEQKAEIARLRERTTFKQEQIEGLRDHVARLVARIKELET